MKLLLTLLVLLGAGQQSWADEDGAFLDAPYSNHKHPVVDDHSFGLTPNNFELERFTLRTIQKMTTLEVIKEQSPIKSQGRRGTCSIFSATGLFEYNLTKLGHPIMDISEQWLEYLTAGQRGSEGSWSYANFYAYRNHGFVLESDWNYESTSWHPYKEDYWKNVASAEHKARFNRRCGATQGTNYFDGCLIGQRDPRLLRLTDDELNAETIVTNNGLEEPNPHFDTEFVTLRNKARSNLGNIQIGSTYVSGTSRIKQLLSEGRAIALDIDFFYGAWNHRKSTGFGLNRDSDMFDKGIVSAPHRDSLDYVKSKEKDNRAGHSVVLVGFDPDVEIEREVLHSDGVTMITVKSTGVYYFKNSWGTSSLGSQFELEGEAFPGFAMISMDYAHQYGTFYEMTVFEN